MSKKLSKEEIKKLIKDFINDSLKNLYNSSEINQRCKDLSYKDLQIKVGFGLGVPAKVSWMAFLKFDQKVSKGIYPVILFNRKDCLILVYGISEAKNPEIDWGKKIENKYKKIKDSNCECNLSIIKEKYPNSYLKECYKLKNGELNETQLNDLIENLDEIIDYYFKNFQSSYKRKKETCFENSNLKLEPHIIKSFYNSLKTKGFIILAGLSGTGKTKIFEEFVKCFPTLDKGEKEKWIVIKETGKKLLPVKKEEIEFNRGKISIINFIESINEALSSETNRKVFLKLNNYYVDLISVIGKLKEKTDLIGSSDITNHLSVYIASLFGFEIIEKKDIEKLNLQKLDKELEIREFERKMSNNLFFPIRPDFKDTKSLLGFYNPLKEKYHSTPLLDFVLESSRNYLEKGNEADPFFVLFDEMNLARVEYYFADFLSVLEAKRFENSNETIRNENFIEFLKVLGKETSVINENNYKFTSQSIKLHNEEKIDDIPKELFLPPNLYFVGTVNIDETTHMFSPKVLDRAFTIEFDVGSFNEYLEFLNEKSENSNLADEFKDKLKQDFINNGRFAVIDKNKIKEFTKENKNIIKKLQDINEVLRKYNLHFGYRVFDEIMMFLYNSQNSQYSFESLDEAFDLAIKMKVLPKFHGTRQKLEEPIIELLEVLKLRKVNSENEQSQENSENQSNNEKKDLIEQISENLKGIPVIENKTLKVSLGEKEFRIQTPYLHTTHKLLEILYKLQTQGFASFM
ncbi:hypothetical protein [Persephonella sp. KM09-Lau-8]|uniref:hypothetical protein n=1 Tax=Persephonella sp. KM09-Lau-8 TaxID=1158345 RepID=UPI0006902ED8|nr:hypothetical protein [Persephonella sp. KM09-Lau-8]